MNVSRSHPAFPQPEDDTVVLWRYMDVQKFRWLVENSRLFMPSVVRLGDPLEGTAPKGRIIWWQREAENANSEEHRHIIENNRAFISGVSQILRNNYYVSCWHMNQSENHAMWQCYTTRPEAVAIRTTYASLRECLPDYIEIGVVRYIDYSEEDLPTMNMLEYIMHKDEYYGFESEVRVVVLYPPEGAVGSEHFKQNHFESDSAPGLLVYAPQIQLNQLIHGVVLHPDASQEFQAQTSLICDEAGLPQPQISRKEREPLF